MRKVKVQLEKQFQELLKVKLDENFNNNPNNSNTLSSNICSNKDNNEAYRVEDNLLNEIMNKFSKIIQDRFNDKLENKNISLQSETKDSNNTIQNDNNLINNNSNSHSSSNNNTTEKNSDEKGTLPIDSNFSIRKMYEGNLLAKHFSFNDSEDKRIFYLQQTPHQNNDERKQLFKSEEFQKPLTLSKHSNENNSLNRKRRAINNSKNFDKNDKNSITKNLSSLIKCEATTIPISFNGNNFKEENKTTNNNNNKYSLRLREPSNNKYFDSNNNKHCDNDENINYLNLNSKSTSKNFRLDSFNSKNSIIKVNLNSQPQNFKKSGSLESNKPNTFIKFSKNDNKINKISNFEFVTPTINKLRRGDKDKEKEKDKDKKLAKLEKSDQSGNSKVNNCELVSLFKTVEGDYDGELDGEGGYSTCKDTKSCVKCSRRLCSSTTAECNKYSYIDENSFYADKSVSNFCDSCIHNTVQTIHKFTDIKPSQFNNYSSKLKFSNELFCSTNKVSQSPYYKNMTPIFSKQNVDFVNANSVAKKLQFNSFFNATNYSPTGN